MSYLFDEAKISLEAIGHGGPNDPGACRAPADQKTRHLKKSYHRIITEKASGDSPEGHFLSLADEHLSDQLVSLELQGGEVDHLKTRGMSERSSSTTGADNTHLSVRINVMASK